jgi:LmbE family N-acetylglucosaminyl deacetylase
MTPSKPSPTETSTEFSNLPPSPGGILHVYAHPDDESFGNPATIGLYAKEGVPMSLITMTRGEAGETNGVCKPEELGDVREAELRAACQVLGIHHFELWGYPDGELSNANKGEVLSRLIATYEKIAPRVIVTYGDEGVTGHPDHLAVSRFATEAFFQFHKQNPARAPERLYWRITPEKRRVQLNRDDINYRTDYTTIIDAREFGHIRTRAESRHRSQRAHTDYDLSEISELGAVDYYKRVFPEWRDGGPYEADLFGMTYHSDETSLP